MYYAVIKGRVKKPTIYETWGECEAAVLGYSGAIYRKFKYKREATKYIKEACCFKSVKQKIKKSLSPYSDENFDIENEVYRLIREKHDGTKGENKVEGILNMLGIRYKIQFKVFIDGSNHLFDFAIFDEKGKLTAFVEFDGLGHFEPVIDFGSEIGLANRQERDRIKNVYCKKNNLKMIRVPYTEAELTEKILARSLSRLLKRNHATRKK